MATNNATGSVTSSLMGLFATLKPQILNIVMEKFDEGGQPSGANLYTVLATLGGIQPCYGSEVSHFELGALQTNFRSNANVASPGAGNPQTIVVSLADVQAGTGAVIPKEGDIVVYKGNQAYGQITNKVPSGGSFALTITPTSTTVALPAVAANETLVILTSAYNEGTGIPQPTNRQPEKLTFPTNHIIKTAFVVTGTAKELQRWFNKNNLGSNFENEWLQGQIETSVKHTIELSNAMLSSPISDNPAVSPTMYGVRNWVQNFGADIAGIPAGTESMATFDLVNRILNKKLAPREYAWMQGTDRAIGIENAIADLFAQNASVLKTEAFSRRFFSGYESDVNEMGISFNFKAAHKGGRTHYFITMKHFSFDQNLGAVGQDFPQLAIIMPLGKTKDAKTGIMSPYWKFHHLGNRHFSTVNTGRGVDNPTDNVDVLRNEILTEGGNEFFVPEHWAIMRP